MKGHEIARDLIDAATAVTAEDRMLHALLRKLQGDEAEPELEAAVTAQVPDPELPPYAELLDRELDENGVRVRARVLYGGRGGAKSWTIARKLLTLAARRPLRILCTREVQTTIADSVHKLLADQIRELGLIQYVVTDKRIRHPNGTEFIFKGLRDPDAVKSAEGVDIVWIEEGQRVSHRSLRTLIPTIRKHGSEVWVSFNPDQATDAIYARYVAKPPPGTVSRWVNWNDNPFFDRTELALEKDYDYETDPDAAAHIWGGELRQGTEAQVFRGKFHVQPFSVPTIFNERTQQHDPTWAGPYYGSDFGFAQDPTTLVECWIDDAANVLYIRRESYKIELDIDDTAELWTTDVPGFERYIVEADSARPDSISYLRRHGVPRIRGAEKGPNSVEEGIRFMRKFRAIIIHPDCKHVEQEFRLYSYKVDRLTNEVLAELVDKFNHTIDAIRYALSKLIKKRPTPRAHIIGAHKQNGSNGNGSNGKHENGSNGNGTTKRVRTMNGSSRGSGRV